MTAHRYEIVAASIPIVYTGDGDHDPDGMVFVPRAYVPLLDWARDRWEDDDEQLPKLHHRRQRAQLVVDGLWRLEHQLDLLRHGPDEDQELLAELLRREHVPEYGEVEDRLSHGPRRRSARAGAVRLNVIATLTELRVALADLAGGHVVAADAADGGLTAQPRETPPPDAEADADPSTPPDAEARTAAEPLDPSDGGRLLVSLTTAQRTRLRARWRGQLQLLDRAIARWFTQQDESDARRLDVDALADASGLSCERIRRLLLNDHRMGAEAAARLGEHAPPYDRFNPMKPIPLLEPLVLRARLGEVVEVEVENSLSDRPVGFHVQGDGFAGLAADGRGFLPGVRGADGCRVGDNEDTTIPPGGRRTVRLDCRHEGVWPINDLADVRGSERGSNAHGLFGALVVEPAGSRWLDPETGTDLTYAADGVGLYVDVLPPEPPGGWQPMDTEYVDLHQSGLRPHREFCVFIHDQPEIHSGTHTAGEHTVMPLSYRAEPMHNRLPHRMRRYAEATPREVPGGQVDVDRRAVQIRFGDELEEQFWTARTPDGRYLERVSGEEQHHSSWLFGEPVTPVFRAYRGDPSRIRLIHAGVKETHVWHLHVHQWRLVPEDCAPPGVHGVGPDGKPLPKGSQLLDAITIGPQTAVTIDPLYGSGSRQHAPGDIIWHCHLYPHFHHGMWGLWRSFDRAITQLTAYPDGTPCQPLRVLPGTDVPEREPGLPGFPWFVDGQYPMKSPPPPATCSQTRTGRRLLLGLPDCTDRESDAMAPSCRDGAYPGATFVALDDLAATWNASAGLPPPRVLSYDVEVRSDRIEYNVDGWHDPRGHHYRLLRAQVRERDDAGVYHTVTDVSFEGGPTNPAPCYPRANHGDVVELRLHNSLTAFGADAFDVGMAPVECGLHVHLVKFDVLAADGSATGWNYLSGASCRDAVGADHPGQQRTVSHHRWVVDEEFGPIFFHDHLLANFRQKHGLYAAMIAQPHGSNWWRVDDQDQVAWADEQAVIVPPADSGLPAYREACLGIGDFVPLLDRGGRPLNPPTTLSGDDDPGSMAVNYRSAPLTHRGDDPSAWFSSSARSRVSFHGTRGDPDTPLIETYPGERVRIRLIQGSHEEQHGFVAHGLRWRREWGNPASPLVNQQTLGISEAFTLDVDPGDEGGYGRGDHLWHFATSDDLWTGCWGLFRVLPPTADHLARLTPLPHPEDDLGASVARMRAVRPTPPRPQCGPDGTYDARVRTYVIVARRTEHEYAGRALTDPWGLVYRVAREVDVPDSARDSGRFEPTLPPLDGSAPPLVLRAHRGEWVRIVLVNDVLADDEQTRALPRFGVEPSPPRLPLEHLDALGRPDRRTVTPRVSLHASLVRYDVTAADGAWVGRNPDQTVEPRDPGGDERGHAAAGGEGDAPGRVVRRSHGSDDSGDRAGGGHEHGGGDEPNWREYWWYADEALAPESAADGPGRVCHLTDWADVRNHRHHGLMGALVVLPGDVAPWAPGSTADRPDGYVGPEAEIRARGGDDDGVVAREGVVFVQDGLRLFVNGHPALPVPDVVPTDDPEDSGHKAISYRSALIHRGRAPSGRDAAPPVLDARAGDAVWLRVVGAGDKPRQHSLTVHGAAWQRAPWVPGGPWTGAISGITTGVTEDLVFRAEHAGDHAIRSGAFRWGTELGVWGRLRVTE